MYKKTLVALAVLAGCGAQAQAQSAFPAKPVRLLVTSAPGSGGDALGRLLAERMGQLLKGTVIVENKPGAGGMLAMDLLARAPADGYTIGLGSNSTHILIPAMNARLSYDPIKDFAPIGQVGGASTLLIAHPDFPANKLDELLTLAKQSKEPVQYASWGNGSSGHFCGALLNYKMNAGLAHVPYKSVAQIQTDVVGGHIQLAFVDMGSGTAMVKSGRAKAIASCTERTPSLPEVGSYTDADIKFSGQPAPTPRWTLYAPAATPAPVVAQLGRALQATLEMADVKAWMANQGISAGFIAGARIREMNREDLAFWKNIATVSNISAE